MADIVYGDRVKFYRVYVPVECAKYIRGALSYARDLYVDEYEAESPEAYWAHVELRKKQIDNVMEQLTEEK